MLNAMMGYALNGEWEEIKLDGFPNRRITRCRASC